jgi:hypothetical protein
MLQPGACPLKPMRIEVDAQGYTRPVTGTPNVAVCLALDETSAQGLIMDALAPVSRQSRP